MARSLVLGLYLLLAGRGPQADAGARPARGDGPLYWLHLGEGANDRAATALAGMIWRDRPDLDLLVTADRPDMSVPDGAFADAPPRDRLAEVRAFLDHWRPDGALFIGVSLHPALIAEAHERNIPLILADAHLRASDIAHWKRGMAASVLSRFTRIFARDSETVKALRRLGGGTLAVEVSGPLEEPVEPLPCNEAEREVFADLLRARPVWLAVACPESEEEAVIGAHIHAMQHAHRLLLIIAPADPARGPALALALGERGLITADRAADEEPDPEVQVLVTDGCSELGLWYRLAPVTFMGGTLSGGVSRDPNEPGALGSAVVHGPRIEAHPVAYRRLTEARGTRVVVDGAGLAAAISELIAPDRAATLAHNAWAATTGGADAAEQLVAAVLASLSLPRDGATRAEVRR